MYSNTLVVGYNKNQNLIKYNENKSRSEPGNAPRIGIGHREVVCQK